MRMIKYGLAILTMTLALFACKKETSHESGNGALAVEGQWEFKQAALSFQGPMDSAYIFDQTGYQELFLIGSSPDVKGRLELRVAATEIVAGAYKNPYVLFQYSESGSLIMQNDPANTDQFELIITRVDSLSVTGTFSGKIIDGPGNISTITEGKFTAPFTKGVVQPPPASTGQLSVWTKQLCSGGGNITVTVNGQTTFLTQALETEPLCGAAGTANFTLPAGRYTVKAVCDSDSAMYEISVSGNNCTLLLVDINNAPVFEDYFPTGTQSFWNYDEASGNGVVNKITSNGPEDIDGKTYIKFTDQSGNTRRYRKEPNFYYEYTTLDFNGTVTDPPVVELIFLKDNAVKDEFWQTPEYDLLVSGLRVRGILRSTLVQRDFRANIGGKQYDNLIEVYTELMLYNSIANEYTPVNSYTTLYAKGIGIVYYENPQTLTQWNIKSYTLTP